MRKVKFGIEIRKCRNCFETFEFQVSQLNRYKNGGKYCSRKCGYEYRVKKGLDAPIKDKYGRTSRKADKLWQKTVRERGNYRCKRCYTFNKYIDTHHVYSRAQRPDLKHDPDNGICLCRKCHTWVHHHPQEAAKAGLLKGEKYEAVRLTLRKVNAGLAQRKGQYHYCVVCGKEKYYPPSRQVSKTAYRCMTCYQNVALKRGIDGKTLPP